jgi:tRNA(Arg) A34 adenosine deaminase TadA
MTELQYMAALMKGYLAQAESFKQAALIYEPRTKKIKGMGLQTAQDAASTYETAIVNILQSDAIQGEYLKGHWCISTYSPTLMCSGMASVKGIKSDGMFWVDGTMVKPSPDRSAAFPVYLPSAAPLKDDGLPADPKLFFTAIQQARTLNKLNVQAAKLFDDLTSDHLPMATVRKVPLDVFETFSTLPKSPAPAPGSVTMRDWIFMSLAFALVGQTWNPIVKEYDSGDNSGERYGGNNVGGVLVLDDQIVGWGINLSAQNRTFHAETLGVLVYLKRSGQTKLPRNMKIYTSLQPCHMCAGFIDHVGQGTDVIVGMRDQGLTTVLDKAGNPSRERYAEFKTGTRQVTNRYKDGYGKWRSEKITRDVITPANEMSYKGAQSIKDSVNQARTTFGQGPSTKLMRSTTDELARSNKTFASPAFKPSPIGTSFVQYADWLVDTREMYRSQGDSGDKRALEQAIELLKIVAVKGLVTTYGLNFVEKYWKEMAGPDVVVPKGK